MFNSFLYKRTGFVRLTLTAIFLTGLLGWVLWERTQVHSVTEVRKDIDHWLPIVANIRCLLIVLLALAGPKISSGLVRCNSISADQRNRLMRMRWRITAWLITIELVLGQGMLVKGIAWMVGIDR